MPGVRRIWAAHELAAAGARQPRTAYAWMVECVLCECRNDTGGSTLAVPASQPVNTIGCANRAQVHHQTARREHLRTRRSARQSIQDERGRQESRETPCRSLQRKRVAGRGSR